jgi:hypothetical protein
MPGPRLGRSACWYFLAMTDTASLITAEGACRGRALQWLHLDPPPFDDDWALHLLRADDRERVARPEVESSSWRRRSSFTMTGVGVGLAVVRGGDGARRSCPPASSST